MKDKFFAGLRIVLPIVLFIIIINWGVGLLFDGVEFIEQFFPKSTVGALNLPELVVKLLVLLILFVLICVIGSIYQKPEMRDKVRDWVNPLVKRIPLLSHLFVVTNEVYDTFQRTDSFKSVVLVHSPFINGWTIAFITNEEPDNIEDVLNKDDMVAVSVPFSPPTSSYLVFFERKDIIETNIPVSSAVSMIVSLGVAGATKKAIKESRSVSWVRLFLFYWCILYGLFFYLGMI